MLPEGMKSLAEIDKIKEADQRLPLLDTLFEYLLREITPNSGGLTWWKLFGANSALSKLTGKLGFAREIRNARAHGKPFGQDDVSIAERAYRAAIDQLLKPPCPVPLIRDVRGTSPSLNRIDHPATPNAEPQPDNTTPQTPLASPQPDAAGYAKVGLASPKLYAVLATLIVSALLIALLAFLFRSTPQARPTVAERIPEIKPTTNPPPGLNVRGSAIPAGAPEQDRAKSKIL